MAEQRPPSAQDEPAPRGPKRVWDKVRQVWIEAMTVARDARGRFAKKRGDEPPSQLCFPF